jgi:hypothetical protein
LQVACRFYVSPSLAQTESYNLLVSNLSLQST